MADTILAQAIDDLAERVVFFDPQEPLALDGIRERFQRIVTLLNEDEIALTTMVAGVIADIDRASAGRGRDGIAVRLGEAVERIQAHLADAGSAVHAAIIDEARQQFIERRADVGPELKRLLMAWVRQGEAHRDEFRRLVHSLKGEAGMVGLDDLNRLCHRMESALVQRPLPLAALGDACEWIRRSLAFLAGRGRPPGPAPLDELPTTRTARTTP